MSAEHYRWADAADAEAIMALVQSAYRGQASRQGWTTEADFLDGSRLDRDHLLSLLPPAGGNDPVGAGQGILLAEDATGVVACAHLQLQAQHCWFGLFAVDPRRQGQGTGDRLLHAAETRALAQLGARVMALQVIWLRDSLIAWYRRRGYVLTGDRAPFPYGDERFGLPRRDDLYFVIMEKPLS